jgi:sec-independent protein translocase protein TatA
VFGLGGSEIGLVFLIILLIFGPSQIPKMARGLGQALREFRKAQREITDEVNREEPPSEKPGDTGGPGTGSKSG